ncbi:hypothetical protein D917_05114 [Trichinella nativa]|uniref:Uncharacterized protein n=1 Tax=Trichinella nativa TaxID=6335 RepID=A0A1Y3F239_9BILA|nr:hypothetical protein D917_05114 [Trichinella nativa]
MRCIWENKQRSLNSCQILLNGKKRWKRNVVLDSDLCPGPRPKDAALINHATLTTPDNTKHPVSDNNKICWDKSTPGLIIRYTVTNFLHLPLANRLFHSDRS